MGHSSPWSIQLSNVTLPGAPFPYDKCRKNSVFLCDYKERSFCCQMRREQNLHSWLGRYGYERDRAMDLKRVTALGAVSTHLHSFQQEKKPQCASTCLSTLIP